MMHTYNYLHIHVNVFVITKHEKANDKSFTLFGWEGLRRKEKE
jgi:hypothetical protein